MEMKEDKSMTEQLIVELGKRYNRADGGISGVIEVSPHASQQYPFIDPDMETPDKRYTLDGKFYFSQTLQHHRDLISEYKEPTAEPQDEWGPWIGWNGGECPVENGVVIQAIGLHDNGNLETRIQEVVGAKMSNSSWTWTTSDFANLIAYRIKKEPKVRECMMYLNENCIWQPFSGPNTRKAIITLTDGKLDIDWADE